MEEIPVVRIGSILYVSIQTELHNSLAENLQATILEKLKDAGAKGVLIDITALDLVDSFVGRILAETARMTRIMDAQVVLVGMSPAVSMTLLEMGISIGDVKTAMNVESGLELLGYRLTPLSPASAPPSREAYSSSTGSEQPHSHGSN